MKRRLDNLLAECKLDENNLDPLWIAKDLPDDAALLCALFAYGNVKAMIKFLRSLDFSLLDASEKEIRSKLTDRYYRFQSIEDVQNIFVAFSKMRANHIVLERVFTQAYHKEGFLFALSNMISVLRGHINSETHGVDFLFSRPFDHKNLKGVSALKRYLMYIRWQVRKDFPDLNRWKEIKTSDLLIPLDTHTFAQASKLGLLKRKSADLLASIELTEKLKEFDPIDPVKYDFALYRLGQNLAKQERTNE